MKGDVVCVKLSLVKTDESDRQKQWHIVFPIRDGDDKANELAIKNKAVELLKAGSDVWFDKNPDVVTNG